MGSSSLDELPEREKVLRALEGAIEDTKEDLETLGESGDTTI